jgi:hypothetical protein
MSDNPTLEGTTQSACSQSTTNQVNKLLKFKKKGEAVKFCSDWNRAKEFWERGDYVNAVEIYEGIYVAAKKAGNEEKLPAAFLSDYFSLPVVYLGLFIDELPEEIIEMARQAENVPEFEALIRDNLTVFTAYYIAMLYSESRYNPDKATFIENDGNGVPQYAYGLGQLRPETAQEVALGSGFITYDFTEEPAYLLDVLLNIRLSLKYFTQQWQKNDYFAICAPDSYAKAIKSYKMGPKYRDSQTRQARALSAEVDSFAKNILKYHRKEIETILRNRLFPEFFQTRGSCIISCELRHYQQALKSLID